MKTAAAMLLSSRALRQAQGKLRCPAKIAEAVSEARQREVEWGGSDNRSAGHTN